ncbi:alpha/beta hydrolase [Thalassomonas viridans]|uniref:Alpha/beta hydrolase n=1 Tax=Thalassomonas viridans TaxID=137584 RepID=A0AAE9ZE09_9GAMM|nr:alpha/beta hydrolase [Thalassomonas viridans]WDE08717.1 alpha/beta hydrolase [Thalassomonas viridans]
MTNHNLIKTAIFSLGFTLLSACNSSGGGKVDEVQPEPVPNPDMVVLDDRSYLLKLPARFSADKEYKLLLAFHGSGSNSEAMQSIAGFEQKSEDYIVAYPQSKVEEWNEGCGCNKPARLGINDLGFVDDVIADISNNYKIIPGEIYAAGFSQGGLFSQNLLCKRSETFKAIASVASPMSEQLSHSCTIAQPTSYMMVHGLADTILPYQGQEHSNFGLISSPDAVQLLARQNGSTDLVDVGWQYADTVALTAFENNDIKTQLYSVTGGGHQWSYSRFDSSREILNFFDSHDQPSLPQYSQVHAIGEKSLHVRAMGENNSGPAVILLSGPNKNFHSDSAWFARLQPQLAYKYRVYAIDRAGNAWSSFDDNASYTGFVDDLYQLLPELGETEVTLVAFASANITARLFQDKYQNDANVKIKNMLWIDPDIFLPHSIAMYQGGTVDWYHRRINDIIPHIGEGNWTERSAGKITLEREEVAGLVGEATASLMDWSYFDLVSQRRLTIPQQTTRAIEISNYYDDLNNVKELPLLTDIKISVIDSDFEQPEIAEATEGQEALIQWAEEGSQWSQEVAAESGGQYIPLTNTDHLVTFDKPEAIIEAIDWLVAQE